MPRVIDVLPAAEKRLLHEAALIGPDVPFALLHAISGLTEDQLRGLLNKPITSSAGTSGDGGTSRLSAFAGLTPPG